MILDLKTFNNMHYLRSVLFSYIIKTIGSVTYELLILSCICLSIFKFKPNTAVKEIIPQGKYLSVFETTVRKLFMKTYT